MDTYHRKYFDENNNFSCRANSLVESGHSFRQKDNFHVPHLSLNLKGEIGDWRKPSFKNVIQNCMKKKQLTKILFFISLGMYLLGEHEFFPFVKFN